MKKYILTDESRVKYILTDESRVVDGVTVYRIKAVIDFGLSGHPENNFYTVGKDQLGGFVESEENLSHDCNCWIDGDSVVFGGARIFDDAKIQGASKIHGQAWIGGQTIVISAEVSGNFYMTSGKIERFGKFKM